MAKLTLNALIGALQGTIGDLVIVRLGDGFYIREKGETPAPSSPSQLAHLTRFGQASLWSKSLLLDPAVKAAYKKACHGHLTPHNVAVSDYMNAPVIQSISLETYTGKPGETIAVTATDDFNVTQVVVSIRTVAGELLEENPAERNSAAGNWLYTSGSLVAPGTTIVIEATARDLPGNSASSKTFFYIP